HEVGVKSALGVQAHGPFRWKVLLEVLLERIEIAMFSRDDGLLGKVAAADAAKMLVRKSRGRREIKRRREHAAAAVFAHECAALLHERETVLERQRARRDEGAVLAEAVARREHG